MNNRSTRYMNIFENSILHLFYVYLKILFCLRLKDTIFFKETDYLSNGT